MAKVKELFDVYAKGEFPLIGGSTRKASFP